MHISAVVVSVNYGDFLRVTLPYLKAFTDAAVIVTDTKDGETAEVCAAMGVQCVQTDAFYRDGANFNKGAGINVGLTALPKPLDWLLFTDADMILRLDDRDALNQISLDPQCFYGTGRLQCPTAAAWREARLDFPAQNTASKWNTGRAGYFQLCHSRSPKLGNMPWYPENSSNAAKSDRLFWTRWADDGLARTLWPAIQPIELHTNLAQYPPGRREGWNWNGRITPRFALGDGV